MNYDHTPAVTAALDELVTARASGSTAFLIGENLQALIEHVKKLERLALFSPSSVLEKALKTIADNPTGGAGCNPELMVRNARTALLSYKNSSATSEWIAGAEYMKEQAARYCECSDGMPLSRPATPEELADIIRGIDVKASVPWYGLDAETETLKEALSRAADTLDTASKRFISPRLGCNWPDASDDCRQESARLRSLQSSPATSNRTAHKKEENDTIRKFYEISSRSLCPETWETLCDALNELCDVRKMNKEFMGPNASQTGNAQ